MKTTAPWSITLLLSLAPAGCGSAEPSTSAVDAAVDVRADAPWAPGDVGELASPLSVSQTPGGPSGAPDLSCLGAYTPPAPSADGPEFMLEVRDFQLDARVEALTLRAYFAGASVGDCAAPGCLSVRTNGDGVATLRGVPGHTLRVEAVAERRGANESLNPARSVHFELRVPAAGSRAHLASISEATRRYMPQSAGLTVAPDAAQLLGVVRDCAGSPVRGARVLVWTDAGAPVPFAVGGVGAAYTNVIHRPDRDQHETNANGEVLVVNLEADRRYRVEAWGVVEAGGAPRRVACAMVPTWSRSVTVRDLNPPGADSSATPCGAP